MEKKFNIAELLKNCPNGMELDCTMYENLYFDKIEEECRYPIECYTIYDDCRVSVNFTEFGEFNNHETAKCVIFPKGKTTWEGFIPPCPFKDGDVISDSLGTCIFKGEGVVQGTVDYYCGMNGDYFNVKQKGCGHYGNIVDYRVSTEKEKQKLFDAIKANGYKWDAETKTLEKLQQFKVGDRIRKKGEYSTYTISHINYGHYFCGNYVICDIYDNDWELVPDKFDITTLKPFYQVLVRNNDDQMWTADMFSFYNEKNIYPFACVGHYVSQCIPYEGNEHLLGTTDDCNEFYKTWK